MDKSQILLSFLQKNCGVTEPIPLSDEKRFEYYKGAINKLPPKYINESFLKIEDGYLSELLQKENIVSVTDLAEDVTVFQNKASNFRADVVLSFLNEGNDKSVYLYGGTRLKIMVSKEINGKYIAVTKANNVYYTGVISAVLPKTDSKLTSVVLRKITDKYGFALDVAMDNNLKTVVLCVPTIENTVICSRVAEAIINTIKQHPFSKNLKIVLLASNSTVFGIYKSKNEVL